MPQGAHFILVCLLFVGSSCAGWRGEGDTYYAHSVPKRKARMEATYRFGMPGSSWRPVRKVKGVQVAWVRPEIAGLIELHAQCDEQGDSSLEQYTDHLRIDWTDWKIVRQTKTTMLERDALRTVVDASIDGIPRRHEFVIVKKNGCLFDLRYSAAPEHFDAGHPAFESVVQGFEFPVE